MTKIAFYGSSLTKGMGASSPEQRFSSIASKALGWEEANLGISGTTVTGRDEDGNMVALESGLARVPAVLEAEPDIVLILYGAEDFAQGRPLGDPIQFRQGTFFWDYDTLLRGLLDELEPEQIVVCTLPYPVGAETPNVLGLTLTDYNHMIRQLAERYRLRLLDAYTQAEIKPGNVASLTADGAYLNNAGHERMAGFLIEHLQGRSL